MGSQVPNHASGFYLSPVLVLVLLEACRLLRLVCGLVTVFRNFIENSFIPRKALSAIGPGCHSVDLWQTWRVLKSRKSDNQSGPNHNHNPIIGGFEGKYAAASCKILLVDDDRPWILQSLWNESWKRIQKHAHSLVSLFYHTLNIVLYNGQRSDRDIVTLKAVKCRRDVIQLFNKFE